MENAFLRIRSLTLFLAQSIECGPLVTLGPQMGDHSLPDSLSMSIFFIGGAVSHGALMGAECMRLTSSLRALNAPPSRLPAALPSSPGMNSSAKDEGRRTSSGLELGLRG